MLKRSYGVVTMLGAAAIAAALFSGCASQGTTTTVDNSIGSADMGLTAVETLAKVYTDLPRCGSSLATTAVCSDPALVAKIITYDNAAYNAMVAARKDKTLIAGALTAIAAFKALVAASTPPAS